MIERIISGGQTGADIGGWSAAVDLGLPFGGTVPNGYRNEVGRIADLWLIHKDAAIIEHSSPQYPPRTACNVRDSDATVIFTCGPLDGGSALTKKIARQYGRVSRHVDLSGRGECDLLPQDLPQWLRVVDPRTLNVAGNRESKSPGIQDEVRRVLVAAIGGMR